MESKYLLSLQAPVRAGYLASGFRQPVGCEKRGDEKVCPDVVPLEACRLLPA